VSHIKRSRTHLPQKTCDKFLYGFKGARLRLSPGRACGPNPRGDDEQKPTR